MYNEAGTVAIKEALLAGDAVEIAFFADTSMPGEEAEENHYINTDTWAHYTYEQVQANHAVTVVGWDDDYSKENFLEGHQPEHDGAWIVKNSWGPQPRSSRTATSGASTGDASNVANACRCGMGRIPSSRSLSCMVSES